MLNAQIKWPLSERICLLVVVSKIVNKPFSSVKSLQRSARAELELPLSLSAARSFESVLEVIERFPLAMGQVH